LGCSKRVCDPRYWPHKLPNNGPKRRSQTAWEQSFEMWVITKYDRYANDRDKREIAPWRVQERDHLITIFIMDFYHLGFREASFDAIWALNCLLHVSKKDLRKVLQGIKTVLKPRGLFYLGMWGGIEFEGVWENDSYIPQRFFAFYPDQRLQAVVADFFEVLYFRPISIEGRELHFQSMILGK
jgi:SAM-dependent methyltransferase